MNNLPGKLRQIMADVFYINESEVDKSTSMETIESWDSLQHLNLILALEQSFGVRFSTKEIETLRSFEVILVTLEERLSQDTTEK